MNKDWPSDWPSDPLDFFIFIWTIETKEDANSIAKGSEDLTCTVCLEQLKGGKLLRSLPCLHQFHSNCIDPWLRQQGTCPVCKLRVGSQMQDFSDSIAVIADMV